MSEPDTSFYDERLLPMPDREYRPEDAAQLRELVEGAGERRPEHALVVVGGGEHLRASAVGERRFEVVRTRGCDRIRAFDAESDTIRAEAGVTWGELREAVEAEERSLARYRLEPEGATIGGLLARWQPLERQWRGGDLRAGCIGLRTASPGGAGYSYLPAPRKASGPDHRYLHVGGEGALGVVLEARLTVAPRQPGVLLEWEAPRVGRAVEAFRMLDRLDVRPAWCRWSSSEQSFEAAVRGPAELLEAWVERIGRESVEPSSISRGERVEARRRELEAAHPAARSSAGAADRHRVVWPLSQIGEAVEAVSEACDEIVVLAWGRQRAAAYLEGGSQIETSVAALARRRIVDDGEAVWPTWVQRLKAELDPEGRLAVGP